MHQELGKQIARTNRPPATPAPPWNAYLAGALAGLAAALVFWALDMQFGVTPFYGWCAKPLRLFWDSLFKPEVLELLKEAMRVKLMTYFALGIPLGAALSAWLAGDWKLSAVPAVWAQRFGPSVKRRLLWAFCGGIIAMFGVRMAGGCPSGLGLSGIIALSASGFVGLAAFFAGGIFTAHLLYGRGAGAAVVAPPRSGGADDGGAA